MSRQCLARRRFVGLLLFSLACVATPHGASAADEDLRWWKGNTHTHSLWSDGNDFPEMIADWYRSHGYHFLALSDHNVLSEGVRWMKYEEIKKRAGEQGLTKYVARFGEEWVETRGEEGTPQHEVRLRPLNEFRTLLEEPGKFLMIQGEEISDRAEGVPIHLNANNITELLGPMGGRTVAETIDNNLRAIEEHGKATGREVFAHLNHPNFGLAVTAEDMAMVLRERFFEVYNGHPGVYHLGDEHHAPVERMWDIANTIRIAKLHAPPLMGVATDDSHNYHSQGGASPGRGWIMVRAASLEPETIIRAINAGDLYASSGVTLDEVRYDRQQKRLSLSIAAEPGAEYTTHFIGTMAEYDDSSQPQLGKDGQPIRATRVYSDDVGKVLATVEGTRPSYQVTGEELYVRAVVTSSQPHDNPSFKDQKKQAWTQPVGWEDRVSAK